MCHVPLLPALEMSACAFDTVLGLCNHLEYLQACPINELMQLITNLHLCECLPVGFLDLLDADNRTVCFRAALVCYSITSATQVPHEMQLRVILANWTGKGCLVSAGTGSGKTLPIALCMLLDDPAKSLMTWTLSPLKHLQSMQESEFNSQ